MTASSLGNLKTYRLGHRDPSLRRSAPIPWRLFFGYVVYFFVRNSVLAKDFPKISNAFREIGKGKALLGMIAIVIETFLDDAHRRAVLQHRPN
jgi:hypothetical protein